MDSGPQVLLGSEKRAWLMSTDIFLLCSYVSATKKSDASYSLISCSCARGPVMATSPLATIISDAVNVEVDEGIGGVMKIGVGAVVLVAAAAMNVEVGGMDSTATCVGVF
jgi:hypothetical protein